MFTFLAFCEAMTHQGKYSYFHLDDELLACLSEEEIALVHCEDRKDHIDAWYPAYKWTAKKAEIDAYYGSFTRTRKSQAELLDELTKALQSGDLAAIQEIQKQMQ